MVGSYQYQPEKHVRASLLLLQSRRKQNATSGRPAVQTHWVRLHNTQHFHRWCLVCRGFNCFTHFFWKDWQLHTLCCTCSDEPVKTGVYSVPLILQIFFPTLSSVLLYMRFCVFQEKEVTHLLCWTFPPCFSSASRSWCHSWTPGSQKGAKKNQIKHMKDL